MRNFWPVAEAAQADYETLRKMALTGIALVGPTAARFARAGLAGLITRPLTEPLFAARTLGAKRAAWSPHLDLRIEALAAGYGLLLEGTSVDNNIEEVSR